MLIKDIRKWTFNYLYKSNKTRVLWPVGQSLGKSEEVIKGVFTLSGY